MRHETDYDPARRTHLAVVAGVVVRVLAAWGQLDFLIGAAEAGGDLGLTNADEDSADATVAAAGTHDDALQKLLRHKNDLVAACRRDERALAPSLLDLRVRDADVAEDARGAEEAERPRDDARRQERGRIRGKADETGRERGRGQGLVSARIG